MFLPSQYLNLYLIIIFLHRFMYILIHQYCIHTKCKSKEKRKISCRSIWGRFFTKWVGHPAPNTHNIERLEMTEIVQKILFLHSLSYKCITKDPSSLYSILVLDGIKENRIKFSLYFCVIIFSIVFVCMYWYWYVSICH